MAGGASRDWDLAIGGMYVEIAALNFAQDDAERGNGLGLRAFDGEGIGRIKHPLGKCLRRWIVFGGVCGVKSLVLRAAGGAALGRDPRRSGR